MPSDISKRVTAIQGNPVSKIDPTTGQGLPALFLVLVATAVLDIYM